MKISWKSYNLELVRPFVIKHGSRTHQPTLIVCIERDGIKGYGEASAIHYYHVSVDLFESVLGKYKDVFEQMSWDTPAELWMQTSVFLKDMPFLLCAIDVAAHDWYSKKQGLPLYQSLGLSLHPVNLLTNFTISYGSILQMTQEMEQYPWPVYKVKLTSIDDILLIPNLLKATNSKIRIDANTGWCLSEIIKYRTILEHDQIEFIEQPLPVDQDNLMKELFKETSIIFIADESVQQIQDIETCVGKFQGINIKVMKCGGITPALQMIKTAREHQLKVMLGCMTESIIGISAISHLLSLVDYADVDGSIMIKNNPGIGVEITKKGQIILPNQSGIGITFLTPDF